jgi:hypothetical protein
VPQRRRLLVLVLLVSLPAGRLVSDVMDNLSRADGLPDFRIYRAAGAAVLRGESPYSPLASIHSVAAGFVYPAPAAWLMTPFALLESHAAALLFVAIATAAVLATLRVLDVRDLRCYGVAIASMPVSTAITTGTVSTLLVLCAALVWRYRHRVASPALALAGAVMLKPLLWPLAIWLAATHRWRAALVATLAGTAGMAAAYAALHVNGLREYPALVRAATAAEGDESYSLFALLSRVGAPTPLLLANVIGVAMLAGACLLARRNEPLSFVVALLAALALAPILWVNSFSLLLIPLCLASRRLTWWWAPPVAMWLVGAVAFDAPAYTIAIVWLLAGLTLGSLRTPGAVPLRRPLPA